MLQIAYSCNDNLFEGLYLSILSILKRTKQSINFYLLTGDLSHIKPIYKPVSDKHIQILNQLIVSFNKDNKLFVVDCAQAYIDCFGKDYDKSTFTPYTLFRLFLDSLEGLNGKLLYLDIDTLANDDISLAFDVNMDNTELCACKDYCLANYKKTEVPVFNAGVLLINLDIIKQTNYFEKARAYINTKHPAMGDEEALFHTWTKIRVWNNELRFNYQKIGIESDTVIKHFNLVPSNATGNKVIKPWNIQDVQNILNLHNWDEDYKYFLDQKKNW